MVVKAMHDETIGMETAETLTGYIAGRETWTYEFMLQLAKRGCAQLSIENMDPHVFADSPEKAIREYCGGNEDIAEYFLSITDVDLERQRVQDCLASPLIAFEVRPPELDDLRKGLAEDCLAMLTLDYGYLHQTGQYEGHVVLCDAYEGDQFRLYDPGPPGDEGIWVHEDMLLGAWRSPNETAGALLLIKA